jgi:acetolactate synthase-1/2/3 large subunit
LASRHCSIRLHQADSAFFDGFFFLGAYPATDKQFVGMLGMHGTYEANLGMHESDFILAIGVRFDNRVTGKLAEFCPHATIVHIDIDPASISKTVKVDVPE